MRLRSCLNILVPHSMKYSLRSLMLAVTLGPPVLAGLYLWINRSVAWEAVALLAGWIFFFGIITAYWLRKSPATLGIGRRLRAQCSFCERADLETGAMAEGPNKVLICYPCASRCKELIEDECRSRGIEPGDPDWYGKGVYGANQCPTIPHPPPILPRSRRRAMPPKPKRRWFQFSLRMLLAGVTLAAMGAGWWKHRSDCLQQVQVHAQRNAGCAKKMYGDFEDDGLSDVWVDPFGPLSFTATITSGTESYTYHVESLPSRSGYDRWSLTLEHGKLPAAEERIQTELNHEAELADQYFHALWRPWERLWIKEG